MIQLSPEDEELLTQYNWATHTYVQRNVARGVVYLHKMVAERMGLDGLIDHINGDKLDCRRENLRLSNKTLNNLNRTGKRGIRKQGWRWTARITFERKEYHLGSYATEAAAWAAYCKKFEELTGEAPRL